MPCVHFGKAADMDKTERLLIQEQIGSIPDLPDPGTPAGRRDRALLSLLCDAGLKTQELLALRLENLDLQIGCVLLPGQKPGEEIRMIPFGQRTRSALLAYLYDIRSRAEGPSTRLFTGRNNAMLSRQAVWKLVRKYGKAAGAGDSLSPEDLRASFAVSVLCRGAEPASVSRMLGIGAPAVKKYVLLAEEMKEMTEP